MASERNRFGEPHGEFRGIPMDQPEVVLERSRSEAIVFVDFLMRYRDLDRLAIEHEAEKLPPVRPRLDRGEPIARVVRPRLESRG